MACEKCWSDAFRRVAFDPSKSQSEHYRDLLEERRKRPCTLKQQRGEDDHPRDELPHDITGAL